MKTSSLSRTWREHRSALVIGHPGHELRVHGWMEQAKPVVLVLTDGSGSTRRTRVPTTTTILTNARCRIGSVYGRLPDHQLYHALLAGDHSLFKALALEIADHLLRERIDYVVSDAQEGFNPGHDVCRYLVDAAVQMVWPRRPSLESYDFPLDGPPVPTDPGSGARVFRLSAAAWDRKCAAACAYGELAAEKDRGVQNFGLEAFRQECLRPVQPFSLGPWSQETPFYESYAQAKLARGEITQVVSFRRHVAPLVESLRLFVQGDLAWAA